jgi:Domain of unknown function (DUF3806)
MQPRIEEPNEAEQQWVASCIAGVQQLVTTYSPSDIGTTLDAGILDRTYAGWFATKESNTDRINAVINSIGFALGQLLVEKSGFRWVVATDEYGCEMAILALPGRGDVLVYPPNLIVKRWQSGEKSFIEHLFQSISAQVRDVESSWPQLPGYFRPKS